MNEQSSQRDENSNAYAEHLDRWMTAQLQNEQSDVSIAAEDERLLTQMINHAQQIVPSADFVNELALRFQHEESGAQTTGRLWFFAKPIWRRAAVGALLLLSAALLITPQTRAALLDVIYGVRVLEQDHLQTMAIPQVTPFAGTLLPRRSLGEIIQQAPFSVQLPSKLPGDLVYANGYVDKEGDKVTVSFVFLPKALAEGNAPVPVDAPTLLLVILNHVQATQPMIDANFTESLSIGQRPALYAHGNWKEAQSNPSNSTNHLLHGVTWDSAADTNWLVWQAGELTYWLQADGLHFDKAAMIQIVESFEEVKS